MSPPNLILIAGREHRFDCTGYAGHPIVKTPNLDALAQGGAWFVSAEAAAGSVADSAADAVEAVLDRGELARLKAAGYHLGYAGPPGGVLDAFTSVQTAPLPGAASAHTEYAAWLASQGLQDPASEWGGDGIAKAPSSYRENFGALRSALPESAHVTEWLGAQAVAFLRSALEPFCLVVCFTRPGEPYDPPAMRERAYDSSSVPLPADCVLPVSPEDAARYTRFDFSAMTAEKLAHILTHYYAGITAVDQQLGRILSTLQSRGLTRNVIAYTALGGELAGSRGLVGGGGPDEDPILKRVPLVVAGAQGLARGMHEGPFNTGELLARLTSATLDGAWSPEG